MLEKLKLQRYLKEETGVSLIMAIMTLFVLSIIGVTLATVTFANVKLTTTDREYQSAYYIAEAGVNETYAEIKELILTSYDHTNTEVDFYAALEPVLLADINDSTLTNFESSLGEQPEAKVSVTKIEDGNPRTYRISSEGKIGQRERTVTKEFIVNWVPKNPLPYLPEGVGAIVKNYVDLGGSGRITGDVYLDTEDENSILMDGGAEVTGDVYGKGEADDSILSAPDWMTKPETKPFGLEFNWEKLDQFIATLPSAPDLPLQGDLIVNGDQELQLNGDYKYNDVKINNGKLKINVGNENHTLVFNTLQIYGGQAGIEIIGTGNVTIFIQETFTFGGLPKVNINGKPEQLTIYYEGISPIHLNGMYVNADFIVKKADVISGGGGGGDRKGLLISGGKKVEVVNGAKMDSIIVAPYAKVFLEQSSGYAGVIISDELTIGNGVILEYKQLDDSDFLYNFITVPNESTTPGGGDTGGLLTPKPNVE